MEKRKLERRLKESVKGASVMSCQQVERFMGYGREKTLKLLKGLDAIEMDGRRKYFIPDIAERIMERTVRT